MNDTFLTIERPERAEIKVKGSRFIAESFVADSVESALASLDTVRRREHAATHHCYAYRVGVTDQPEFKYSDDGEPSGTAGKPIYDLLEGRDITNTLVVVTRYFGGTKLGTGGLVRAYSDAAREVLDKSGAKTNYLENQLQVILDFPHFDSVKRLISKLGAKVVDSDFAEKVTLKLSIRNSRFDQLIGQLTELTSGKADIEKL